VSDAGDQGGANDQAEPAAAGEPPAPEVEPPAPEVEPRREPFLFQLVRTAIAPPVLKDGGTDAPMSRRGRIIFRSIVAVLVVAIAVLLVVTATTR